MEFCRWRKVYAECMMEFYEVVGYKLRSRIRGDFLGNYMVTVNVTYEGFDDISSVELLLMGYYPNE